MEAMMRVELIVAASSIMAIDQLSKKVVMRRGEEIPSFSIGSIVRIRHIANTSRNTWLGRSRFALLLLWSYVVLSITLLVHFGPFFQSHFAQVGVGAALGGATGNLYDILLRRAVIDFIDFGFWPVFNLADVAIVFGVAVALWFAG